MPATATARRAITPRLAMLPVTKIQLKPALNSSTRPNRPAIRPQFLRFAGSAPAAGLDRAVGRDRAEGEEGEEVDHVLQVRRYRAERVEMAHRRQVGDEFAHLGP